MNNKVAKFDKFIKDNDAKRRRAIQKYQIEVLLKEQKQTEYEQLCEQLAALKRRSVKQKISYRKCVKWHRSRQFMTTERKRERERGMHMGMFHIMNADKNADYELCKLHHHMK